MNLLSMTKIGVPTVIGYIAMYFMTFPTGQEIVQVFAARSKTVGSSHMMTGQNPVYILSAGGKDAWKP